MRMSLVLALALCLIPAAAAQATITVANSNDSGPGSLRQAIADAAPGETIVVPPDTYSLTSGELAVAKSLTITGHGAADTIVRAAGVFRVFRTSGAANAITITGLTIRDGQVVAPSGTAEGGGVLNQEASLTLSHVLVTNNHASADGASGKNGGIANGGGVASPSGALTLADSELLDNMATALGGSEKAGGIAEGGGLYNNSTFTLERSTISGNLADARGGQGPANAGQAGGIATGGGIFSVVNAEAGGSMTSSTLAENLADSSGGPGANPGIADGGGAYVITNSPPLTLTNLTITGNVARAQLAPKTLGTPGTAQGGGLFDSANTTTLSLTNATLSANAADGAGATGVGGNLYSGTSTKIKNTIVSAGTGAAGSENCGANGESLGHNLENMDQCGFHAAGDQINTNPLLGSLQNNGGPVQTEALSFASPAVNAGDNIGCPSTDARGVMRPQGTACDIGAFELAPPSATTAPASGIGMTLATLQGSASNPDVLAGSVFFQWGTSTAYGSQTLAQSLTAGSSAQQLSAALSNLVPGVVYHFRAVATTPDGTSFGADKTFTTATNTTTAPVIANVAQSHRSWREGNRLASFARKRRASLGTTFYFTLNEQASVRFAFTQQAGGRRVKGKCVAQTKKNRRKSACKRTVTEGALSFTGHAGTNKVSFQGRISASKKLSLGRYTLVVTAIATAGQRSQPKSLTFTIVR